MFRMVVGHSDDVDTEAAAEALIEQCAAALGTEAPRAGLLFSAYDADLRALVARVRAAFPDVDLIGTTSFGEMTSALGFQEDSFALALFVSDTVDITSGAGRGLSRDRTAAVREAVEQARSKTAQEPRLCLAFPAVPTDDDDPVGILEDLRAALGPDVTVLGGGSAAESVLAIATPSFQFHDGEVLQDAVTVLLFSGPLTYSFGVETGWRPVGKRGLVTRTGGGVVEEIDGEPAIEFFRRYLGPSGSPSPATPLAVFAGEGDQYYLRVCIEAETGGGVRTTGGLPQGARVQLATAVTDEIFDGARSALQQARKGYPEHSEPAAALLFSCGIRKLMLGTRTGREFELAAEELGADVPIAGFYCMGEIAPVEPGAASRIHHETMVAVLLGAE